MTAAPAAGAGGRRAGSGAPVAPLLAWCSALVGVGIGGGVLADNSFLTHLATGRVMLERGILRADVFTWTSAGEPVVVQSWLASLVYGLVDGVAGPGGLRSLFAVTVGVLAWLLWRSTEGAPELTARIVAVVPVLAIGSRYWTERPLLLGLVALTLVVIVGDRARGSSRILVAVGFVWVKVHGSWPLGLVWLAASAAGAWIDRRSATGRAPGAVADEEVSRRLRAAAHLGGGILAGGILDPYLGRLLVFPVHLLGRREILSHVAEWRAPTFATTPQRLFLLVVGAGIVALVRRGRWSEGLPVLVFVAAALMSRRNIPVACVGLAPLIARGLPVPALVPARGSRLVARVTVLVAGVTLVAAVLGPRPPHLALDAYPVTAVDALEGAGLRPGPDARVVHSDRVGNYLAHRYGPTAAAFVDDRYELHPRELLEDYLVLVEAGPRWVEVLDRWRADALLWESDSPLVGLARGAGWPVLYDDGDWTVLCRPGVAACG